MERKTYIVGFPEDWTFKKANEEVVRLRSEQSRLTKELEAAEAKGREAGLEEAANYAERRRAEWERQCSVPGHFTIANSKVTAAIAIKDGLRALKAPAIGSQGTEKGRG